MKNEWESHWGRTYDPESKGRWLKPLFEQLEKEGKLGTVIVDVGSGTWSILDNLPFTPQKKKVHIDIAAENDDDSRVQFDVEKINQTDSIAFKRALLQTSEFLGIDPRKEQSTEHADTIVFSEILNYVDYQEVLGGFNKYLKTGGRIIILNMPGRGVKDLFSEDGVKDNFELFSFLEKSGFNIEYKMLPWKSTIDADKAEESNEMLVLVAVKK